MEVGDWHVLWRAIVRDHFTDIPTVVSTVLYHPAIHAHQANGQDIVWALANFQVVPPLLCTVNQVALLSTPTPDCRVFVRFNLRPLANEEPAEGFGGHLIINEHGPVYEIDVTPVDLRRESINVPANMANGLFNPPPPPEIEQTQFLFIQEAFPVGIKYSRNGRLSVGWSIFVREKMLAAEDTLIFTRINNNLALSLRRHVPGRVPRAMIGLAIINYADGDDFNIDYYPQAGFPVVTLVDV